MNYDRTERIRRAAILVASLEEALAERMLQNLPPAEAAKIRAEVDRLEEIDPDELRDVLDEFRLAGRRSGQQNDGVEFTYSAPKPHPTAASSALESDKTASSEETAIADAALIAELLSLEHPQTIAAALSRLDQEQGAAVFAALSPTMQDDVLNRLANLQTADETTIEELQSQLQQRIELQRHRRQQAAAGVEMARRIISKTAPAQRSALLAKLSLPKNHADSMEEVDADFNLSQHAEQVRDLEEVVRRARELLASHARFADDDPNSAIDWIQRDSAHSASLLASDSAATSTESHEDCSQTIESLNDADLLRALQLADERTVQRALACSSDSLFRRVAARLPRRVAARLKHAVRTIGPTRLDELQEAQRQLVRLATDGRKAVKARAA